MVYTKWAEYASDQGPFLLLASSEEEAPALHHRFLDRRSPLPLHHSWADWLWRKGLRNGTITPLQSVGITAYRCTPNAEWLREDLSQAVASGRLTLPEGEASTSERREGGILMDKTLKPGTGKNKRRRERNKHGMAALLPGW